MCNELKVGQFRKVYARAGAGLAPCPYEVVCVGNNSSFLRNTDTGSETVVTNMWLKENTYELGKYDHFKIDDPVIVVSQCVGGGIYKYRAHFAGVSVHGSPMVWPDGQTSHTSGTGIPLIVDEVRRV